MCKTEHAKKRRKLEDDEAVLAGLSWGIGGTSTKEPHRKDTPHGRQSKTRTARNTLIGVRSGQQVLNKLMQAVLTLFKHQRKRHGDRRRRQRHRHISHFAFNLLHYICARGQRLDWPAVRRHFMMPSATLRMQPYSNDPTIIVTFTYCAVQ